MMDRQIKTIKQLLTEDLRPIMRLSEVERLIKRHRIIIPPLSRKTLQRMCEDGTLESPSVAPGLGWLVYEDSFLSWIERIGGVENKNSAKTIRGISAQNK
jgi:hypothetical protein